MTERRFPETPVFYRDLGKLFLTAVRGEGVSKLYLVPGGSEATETAIKLARQYHVARGRDSKYRTLAVRPSYHGGTLGALSVTGRESLRKPYLPLLSNEHHAPAPYCYRCPLGKSYPDCGVACADALSDLIEEVV